MVGILPTEESFVYRGLQRLTLNIIGNSPLFRETEIKSVIHRGIGDDNSYERVGIGDTQITIPLFVENTTNYNEIVEFFRDTRPFILSYRGEISDQLNLVGNIKQDFFGDGVGEMTLVFTTAQGKEDVPFGFPDGYKIENTSSVPSWLKKLRNYGTRVFDFTSNTNESIGGFTNAIAQYSYAIENIGNGVGDMSSIVTNPINSVRSSASSIIGGIGAIITGMQNAVSAILSVPEVVDGIIDQFLLLGDQINDLFGSGTKDDQLKQSCDFLGSVGEALIEVSTATNNASPDISTQVFNEDGVLEIEFRPEYFITKNNTTGVGVLMLSSVLISMYRNTQQIGRWNTTSLNNLRDKTELIYNYLSSQDIPYEVKFEMDLARSDFFKLFKILAAKAIKTVDLTLNVPRFLLDVVYEVNGNYDYYLDTKKLNDVVGGVVEGKVKIISNA